jgi:CelD/BcsL family acetyltransferase involved in cellulose biosynthesis
MEGTLVGISIVRPSELGSPEIAAWHDMQVTKPTLSNPFLSPEFTVAVGRVRPTARVAVLSDGQDITGFFPFELRGFGLGLPIAAGLNGCQGLVHAPGADWDARALLRACRISAWQFDHLLVDQKPFERYHAAVIPSSFADFSHGFAAYYASLKATAPTFCSELERKARKLAREVGELRLVADSQEVRILRLLMSWKSDQYRRTGRLDRFSQPWIIDLLDGLIATHTKGLSGILSVLYAGEVPVAAHFGLRCGPVLVGWFPAYDSRFRKYSPGLLHHLRLFEEGPAAGIEIVDFGKGTKPYKETLKNGEGFLAEGIITRRSPAGASHRACRSPQASVIRQIRAHPALFSAADAVLRRGAQVRNLLLPDHTATPDCPASEEVRA